MPSVTTADAWPIRRLTVKASTTPVIKAEAWLCRGDGGWWAGCACALGLWRFARGSTSATWFLPVLCNEGVLKREGRKDGYDLWQTVRTYCEHMRRQAAGRGAPGEKQIQSSARAQAAVALDALRLGL